MKRYSVVALLIVGLAAWAGAQTVTVDASLTSPNNTTQFASLQMAVKSFQASGSVAASTDGAGKGVNNGNAAADVIEIVTTAPYTGFATLDQASTTGNVDFVVLDAPLTIQGQGGNRATIIGQAPGFGAITNSAIFVRQAQNVTLKNLNIIPATTSTPTRGLYLLQPAAVVDPAHTLENVTITANKGGVPLTLTGLDAPDPTGATGFLDDAMYAVSRTEGGSLTVNATNFVISYYHLGTGNSDGIIMFMQGTTADLVNCFVNLGEGCVISYARRFAVQNPYGGYLNAQGTKANPVIFYNIGTIGATPSNADALWNFSDASGATQPTICEVNYAIFAEIGGSAVKEQEDSGRGFIKSVSNSIFANIKQPAIQFYSKGALPLTGGVTTTATVSDCSFYNCAYAPSTAAAYDSQAFVVGSPTYTGTTATNSNRDVVITNCVIAGGFGSSAAGVFNSSTGNYSVNYSALVTDFFPLQPIQLAAATGGASAIAQSNVINDAPIFAEIVNPLSSAFLDVRNPAYGGKASAGADLKGGADYLGDYTAPAGATTVWSLYE